MGQNRTVALVVGASGITGGAVLRRLVDSGVQAHGLARAPGDLIEGATPIAADLLDEGGLRAALAEVRPTHVYYTSWTRRPTETENCEVNARMMRTLFGALEDAGGGVQHVALVTGLKHYLGPFDAYGQGAVPDTPFLETEDRLPGENFYYAQEDELFAAAARLGFRWSVHRSHTVIGFALGNAMNMALTLGAQAAICRRLDRPMVFPGSSEQWNGVTDLTDADHLAHHMVWAATTPAAADQAFNVVNGDVFRWRRLWPQVAEHLGVAWEGFDGEPRPIEQQMAGLEPVWAEIAAREGLVEADLARVASWWHTDLDLGRTFECFADFGKSRAAGFTGSVRTAEAFLATIDRYREARVLPTR